LFRTYQGTTAVSQDQISKPRSHLIPVSVASVLAMIGIAGFLFLVRTPGSIRETVGEGMISAAAIDRAGATEVPTSITISKD
jgi:hypothetical protein